MSALTLGVGGGFVPLVCHRNLRLTSISRIPPAFDVLECAEIRTLRLRPKYSAPAPSRLSSDFPSACRLASVQQRDSVPRHSSHAYRYAQRSAGSMPRTRRALAIGRPRAFPTTPDQLSSSP